jgi:hypothetical protein
MLSNLIYRSNYNNEDFNKVVHAAQNGENELLQVISSEISINVKNEVKQKIYITNKKYTSLLYIICMYALVWSNSSYDKR